MNIHRGSVFALVLTIAGGLGWPATAGDGAYTRLHVFCSETQCDDGANPQSPLLVDPAGNVFGTSYSGGTGGCGTESCGTVFELKPRENGRYGLSTMYNFCSESHCADGVLPLSGVIMDTNGNLYGTTSTGGITDTGTAYELVRHGQGKGHFRLIHTFCTQKPDCADGASPEFDTLAYQGAAAGALYDGASPLYGTGQIGGTNGEGVVYALDPPAKGKQWHEEVLYSFCAQSNCTDGSLPQRGLLLDGAGNLYGSTSSGGAYGQGVIFELSQSGGSWSETVLYSFCPDGEPCTDGTYPAGPLTMDSSGNLYGTTSDGGSGSGGVLFRLVPDGVNSTYSVLYAFCSLANCADGGVPTGKLVMDGSGDILGLTSVGGAYSSGIVYDFDGSALHVLHAFCRKSGCPDGSNPIGGGLSADASGNLYGATVGGGDPEQFAGVVFRLAR